MTTPYTRDLTYSAHTQDIRFLIDAAAEQGVQFLQVKHPNGWTLTASWVNGQYDVSINP